MINARLVNFYKKLFAEAFRDKVTMLRNSGDLNTIRKNILSYYGSHPQSVNDEIQMVLSYLKNHPLQLFPYHFPKKYKPSDISVHKDPERDLHYIFHDGKRMYFKRSWSVKDIRENYTNLLIEQDIDSPHRYLTNNFKVEAGEVVADIGAAEGIFSLPIIEKAKKIVLFETDKEWIEALEATFSPWNDKVKIVNKFVSDKDDAYNITLDEFCGNQNISFDIIKIDVDGAEHSLLKGCDSILSKVPKIKLAICTYHKAEDEKLFQSIFKNYGIASQPSKGYIIFYYDKNLCEPYLRRGLLRASK